MGAEGLTVRARIVLVSPPCGVVFALQRGRKELVQSRRSTGRDVLFDFTFGARRGPDGRVRFSGEFAQGPTGGRFVYVNSGTLAGQVESPWTRRAKVGLEALPWATIERAARIGVTLQARIAGVARDGGPVCASVPLMDGRWTMEGE